MEDVWKCATTGERHHVGCLTASDIHKTVRVKAPIFSRPILFHTEGPMFHKLFQDCDTNGNMCLEYDEAMSATECKRDCKWKHAWIETFCD